MRAPDPDPVASPHLPLAAGAAGRAWPLPLFLLARFASVAALQMQVVAVGWQVYAITESALYLGLIGLIQFAASFCLALPAGQAADRLPRRVVLVAALLIEAVAAAGLGAMIFEGTSNILAIFGLIGLYAAASAFDQPALAALLPNLVRPPQLGKAVAASSAANQAAVLLGPILGGWLYSLESFAPFVAAASCLALGAGAAALIRAIPAPRGAMPAETTRWQRILGGLRFVWKNETLLGAMTLDLFGVLFGGATALLPIYARDILQIGPLELGVLYSASAVGALLTATWLSRHPLHGRVGRTMLHAVAAFGLATIIFGLSRSLPLSLLALTLAGAADMVSVVVRGTLVQTETPDGLRGRVSSVSTLFISTSNQLGEFKSGLMAAGLGPVGSVIFGGTVTIGIVALWGWRFRSLRRLVRD